jgi:putative copper resistance protein D
VVLLGLGLAVLIATGWAALTGAGSLQALGLPDPGAVTQLGLPIARTIAEVSAVLTVGSLLLAAFFVPPQPSGYLDVTGYRAVHAASYAAAVWAVASMLMVPLSVADAVGRPVDEVLSLVRLYALVPALPGAQAWTVTAAVALVVFAGCRLVLSWGWTVVLFGVAVFGLMPVAVTGHSAAGGAHDLATDSLLVHAVAAALWVGGLVAVLSLAGRRAEPDGPLPTAVRRFSRLALVCWIAMAVSGVVNAAVRIGLGDLFTTSYGGLVLAKSGALVGLGVIGYWQRRRSVAAVTAGRPGSLLRLGSLEVLVMLGTIGLAMALGRTAPPATAEPLPSRTEVLIGYDLDGAPTALRLLFDGRFDLILGTLALLLAGLYLAGVRRLRRRGDAWPVGRTAAWLVGCAALLLATSSGIGRYAPAMFSVHMAQHMLLSMLVPILLVLGAPVTLALRTLPAAGRGAAPGPREWLLAAVHSKAARVLTHPLVTLPLFVGSYYALYFSGLFAAGVDAHWAHLLMSTHFIVVGFLFFWPLIGIDPAPRRLPPVVRLGVVFLSLPFHAFFGVILMSSASVIGRDFYAALGLPWVPDLLADQRLGGGLAWASGELPLLIVLIALVVQWSRLDERTARRADRRADADGDAELNAYNSMLRRLAAGEPQHRE